MSRNEKRIRDACLGLGVEVESLVWEPPTSGCEMEGMRGGWLLNGSEPIGLSTKDAIEYLREVHGVRVRRR